MAASFASASSQRLLNSASPITAVPFTVGCWLNKASTTTQNAWCIVDTGTTNNVWRLANATTTSWIFACQGGGTAANATVTLTVAVNEWVFIVCRAISATNRRISVLAANGSTVHAQSTTSRTPTGIDTIAIGSFESSSPTQFWDGLVGEFWYTNTDIQPDAGQLLDSTLRQLAYGGPFSVPHITKDIVEYRSFRKHPVSDGDVAAEVFHGKLGRQTWTNTNGATIGAHPPLPYWYRKPGQYRRVLTI